MLIYYVYAYLRSDGTPYYIGKGKKSRAFKKSINHYPPEDKSRVIFIKENLDEYEALDLEKRMIRWYGRKDLGTGILRNLTEGGDGTSGLVMSEESRKKMSISHKGKPTWNKGKTCSAEHRRKVGEARRGKNRSEETRKKISEARKGKIFSEEHRKKMSEAHKGKKYRLGKTHSEESRRKMSEAKKRTHK